MILQGLKPRIYNRLKKFGKKWLAELPSVIWSLRNTPSRAMGFTPFFLVYGAKPSSPLTWSMAPRGYGPTTSKATALPTRTPSTNWRKPETSRCYTRPSTSKPYDATKLGAFGAET